jgi:uncharacterized protein (DUF2384 family)
VARKQRSSTWAGSRLAGQATDIWQSGKRPRKRVRSLVGLHRHMLAKMFTDQKSCTSQEELNRLVDEYILTKAKYKTLGRHRKQREAAKRRYQELEKKILPQIPDEHRYGDWILIKGHNDYGEHIQVFSTASLQRRRNHQEVLTHSEHLQRIIKEEK